MAVPETMTLTEFARHIGCKQSYASELKRDGRLVMSQDGKRVQVAESIARIEATRDPSKAGVAQRHALERGADANTGHETAFPPLDGDERSAPAEGQYSFQDAKAKREHWAAEREHAAFRKEVGELMERGEVVAAFADAGAALRAKLEAWASVLPPQLIGRDEAAIRATLADQVEQLLHDLVGKFNKMAEGEK